MPTKKSNAKPKTQMVETPTKDPHDCSSCSICHKPLNNNANSVKCSMCKKYTHLDCIGISKQLYQNLESCIWFTLLCKSCRPKLDQMESAKTNSTETNESPIINISASLDAIKEELKVELKEALKEELCNLKKDTMQNPELQATTNHLSIQQPKPYSQQLNPQIITTQTNTENLIREAVERDRKRSNAILFGLEASDDIKDIDIVRDIIQKSQLQTISTDEIIDISRIGRDFKNSDGTTAPRLCRVICKDETCKRKFIHTINYLAKTLTDLKNLRCRPDLTIQQRARARVLRTELKNRLDSGEKDLYIDYRADCIKNKPYNPQPSIKNKPYNPQPSFNPLPQTYLNHHTITQD